MKRTDYVELLAYYRKCFDFVDCFHFNSEISRRVFTKYVNPALEQVIPITHGDIKDKRVVKSFDPCLLHIGFIGNDTSYKGLPFLKAVLKDIGQNEKWTLSVWGGKIGRERNLPVLYRGKFNRNAIHQVYTEMDVLIVPSIWKETFSLVTLEALSYGTPVIVSENVGAQDLVRQYDSGFIYSSSDELKRLLQEIIADRTLLRNFNLKIVNCDWSYSIMEHARKVIDNTYY